MTSNEVNKKIGYVEALKDVALKMSEKSKAGVVINEDTVLSILTKLTESVVEEVDVETRKIEVVDHFIQSISRNNEQKI